MILYRYLTKKKSNRRKEGEPGKREVSVAKVVDAVREEEAGSSKENEVAAKEKNRDIADKVGL